MIEVYKGHQEKNNLNGNTFANNLLKTMSGQIDLRSFFNYDTEYSKDLCGKKREKGERIKLNNGFILELCKGTELENKNIPGTEIKIGEDEYFLKIDIIPGGKYLEYINFLQNVKDIFKKYSLPIEYVKRQTWLANENFINYYSSIKEGENFKLGNIKKIFNRTKSISVGEIKYVPIVNSELDPMMYIHKGSKLYEFLHSEQYYNHIKDNPQDEFLEAEMRLDLNKI